MCAGGPIPESYKLGLPVDSQTLVVKRGSSSVDQLPVEPGVRVQWTFKLASHEVNFFAFFTTADMSGLDTSKLAAVPAGATVLTAPARVSEGAGAFTAPSEGAVILVRVTTCGYLAL